jgi:hypothetical protein
LSVVFFFDVCAKTQETFAASRNTIGVWMRMVEIIKRREPWEKSSGLRDHAENPVRFSRIPLHAEQKNSKSKSSVLILHHPRNAVT